MKKKAAFMYGEGVAKEIERTRKQRRIGQEGGWRGKERRKNFKIKSMLIIIVRYLV